MATLFQGFKFLAKIRLLLAALMLLEACATAPEVANIEAERALPPSAAVFWQHVSEAGNRDWFYLLNSGEEALAWRLAMIDSAHSAIDMETFLWKPDKAGMRVLAHLLAAADRGVRVRLLLDDSFTPHEDMVLHDFDLHPNIELRIYNPYHHRPASMVGRTLFNLGDFGRVNHRLHNKTLVVDRWVANVGGRNLADEYFGLNEVHNFRDMEVLTMGESVVAMSNHFDAFWNSGWSFPVGKVIEAPTESSGLGGIRDWLIRSLGPLEVENEQVLEKRWQRMAQVAIPGRAHFVSDLPASRNPANSDEAPNQLAQYLERVIAAASSEVIIVTAYLVPTKELLSVIQRVEARGVQVRILTNSLRSNNHLAAHAAYRGYIHSLVGHGVELYELRADAVDRALYMEHPVDDKHLGLHAKFLLVDDDQVFVGSANLDPRSLKLNTEVGLLIKSHPLNQALRQLIEVDFAPRNAWSVQLDPSGEIIWVGESQVLKHGPADSAFQRLEDWFMGLLPIDSQM
jgi:putative cardiolipin synthase